MKDLGERFLDTPTWQLLPGMPALGVPPPTPTGACDSAVFYKFTPPACVKTVDVQIGTRSDTTEYAFGVADTDDFLCE